MAALGIGVGVLTGETVEAARDDVFAGLASGRTGIVLTTPEFLSIHRDRFARSGRIGFVVIDEAHHAGLAKGGDRSAYLDIPDILKALGDPVVMAATATATAPVVRLLVYYRLPRWSTTVRENCSSRTTDL
ncbi:MAG: DEAD/DEAH box helicase family protein [Collinsella aerofaciens]